MREHGQPVGEELGDRGCRAGIYCYQRQGWLRIAELWSSLDCDVSWLGFEHETHTSVFSIEGASWTLMIR